MTDIRQSACDLTCQLQSKQLRATDLMDATLDRIDAVNPSLNAIVGQRPRDVLMDAARAADAIDAVGPLHGLPIAIKDLVEVAGVVSTHGSPLYADHIPAQDDLIAARLRAAGAIVIGKTNVPEFGLGSHTFNPVYGATGNPYAPSLTCGGSSGGAAVALATGMTALADGSDMMGSLRNPAAWNNVYGFRPSFGVVPSDPEGDTFLHQLSTLGPMARSPEDIALLLDVIAGVDPRQPHNLDIGPVSPLSAVDPKGLRIGWLGDWGGAFPMEDGIMATSEGALNVLEGLGCIVEPVAPPFPAEKIWDSWTTLRSWQVGAGYADTLNQRDQLKDSAIWEIERGLALSAMDIHRASVARSGWYQCAAGLFDQYDALVLPSAQVWPFSQDISWPTQIAGQRMDTYHRWMEVMVPVSLIGLPCLGAPAGFGASHLPMGIQMFGRHGSDRALLGLGAAYHAATQWPQKRPAM